MSEPPPEEILRLPAEVTRVVVLGDPHGDLVGLELALEREAGPDTCVLSAGDNVGYADGVVSSYICQVLAERGVRSVLGNHEAWSLDGEVFQAPAGYPRVLTPEALAWCAALPLRIRIESPLQPDLRISLTHALPDWAYVGAASARRFLDLEEADLVLCGHTHRPTIFSVTPRAQRAEVEGYDPRRKRPLRATLRPGVRLVVDAGSLARPSRPRRGARAGGQALEFGTYALLDLEAGEVSLHSVDKRARLREILEAQLQG